MTPPKEETPAEQGKPPELGPRLRKAREAKGLGTADVARQLRLDPLPPEKAEPIAYMVNCIETKTAPEGMVALDINVDVVEIMDAAKRSVASGASVALPLKK